MVRKDGAFTKRQRLAEIRRFVAQYGPIPREELVPFIEVRIGLRSSTVEGYLDLLVRSKQIAYDETEDVYQEVKAGGQHLGERPGAPEA